MRLRIVDLALGVRLGIWNQLFIPIAVVAGLIDRIFGGDRMLIVVMWMLREQLLPLSFRRLELCYRAIDDRISYLLEGRDL